MFIRRPTITIIKITIRVFLLFDLIDSEKYMALGTINLFKIYSNLLKRKTKLAQHLIEHTYVHIAYEKLFDAMSRIDGFSIFIKCAQNNKKKVKQTL